jgi:exodeoxyribonuclease VII small subunit
MSKKKQEDVNNDLDFEKALHKLEGIVESMEGEELPLEMLLQKYEEGMNLTGICQSKLVSAEQKIQNLETDEKGAKVLKPVSLAD